MQKEHFPSPVIPKVLFLYSQMHDLLAPSSQKKLVMPLQAAANLRFGRIKRKAIDSCAGEQRVVGEAIDDVKVLYADHEDIHEQLTWPLQADWHNVFDRA